MNNVPVANRLHIALFGRRNVGKSSLINALTAQSLSVVSEIPGTTTDPVYKTMELLPIGPVVIIDTAGMDDFGDLGNLRVEKTYDVLRKTDYAVIVISAQESLTDVERDFVKDVRKRGIPAVCVVNKSDLKAPGQDEMDEIKKQLDIPVLCVSSASLKGIEGLKEFIAHDAVHDEAEISIVGDLIRPGDLVVLVTPIDKAAPKGRLILPQQQTLRDIIDNDAIAVVTKENKLKETLDNLHKKPSLVITDSQAFLEVSKDTPPDIPLTSFSILFARYKGELVEMVKGLKRIESLGIGDRVLVVEGCTHHRQADDIGKVKIPRWISQIAGEGINFEWASGNSFPKDIKSFDAIIHCGGCMLNKMEMHYRINYAKENGVAMTNYGMLIAYVQGILKRALQPFPAASMILEEQGWNI